ncbi:hypothetical protein ACQ4PT_015089 [Festuca glaucescens]
MWQETPELRYLSLPVEPELCTSRSDRSDGSSYRSVCPTDGARAVRLASSTVWSLPGYHGVVPRIRPTYPTVNLHDPDVLCFVVHKTTYDKGVDGDLGTRLIELDTKSMELRSVCYYDPNLYFFSHFVASAVSQYFDASSRSRAPAGRIDVDREAPARPLKLTFPRVVSPQEMLATLREIPDLARDDMMKVYGVLACDERRFKFRSLLALPIDTRKDYCLLTRKLSCFDV